MLDELITSSLVLVLGYAYPAFECYKTIEKNRVEVEELRFWCQYWIIMALLRIFESIGDAFMTWLPMYSEAKLALIIYLWYPKTKGTRYIYDTLLKPYVSRHEPDIDRSFLEFRSRAFDLAIYYWQNCTELGQAKFFQLLDFASPSRKSSQISSEQRNGGNDHFRGPPPPPSAPSSSSSFSLFRRNKPSSDKRRSSPPPPPPRSDKRQPPPPQSPRSYYSHRSIFHPSKPETVQVYPAEDLGYLDPDYLEPGSDPTRSKYKRSN